MKEPGLLISDGPDRGRYISIPEGEPFWMGRKEDLNFVFKEFDSTISSVHCLLLRKGSNLVLEDQSTNGTRLNGYMVHNKTVLLRPADLITIGENRFEVVDLKADREERTTEFDLEEAIEELRKRNNPKLKLPEKIGPYLIIDLIGRGSSGIIYKAIHREERRAVALKVLSKISDQIIAKESKKFARFQREAKLLKKIDHPGFISLFDSGITEIEGRELPYLALEYFASTDLNSHIKINGKMDWKEVLSVLHQLTNTLDHIHSLGIIHRDIKPHNIMYNCSGRAKIIDLGLGKCILDEDRKTFAITAPNTPLGTFWYMPLEQWEGAKNVDERSDLYSLGATAYFLLSGKIPYGECLDLASLYETIIKRRLVPLEELVPDTPKEILHIIKKMMSIDVELRFPTSKKVFNELDKLMKKYSVT